VYEHDYELRGSEVRTLATIGAFRVVPVSDLHDERGRSADLWHGDLDRLRSAGLIPEDGIAIPPPWLTRSRTADPDDGESDA
jgi:hypothetical protein